ncbi:MAG: bacillithiol biosynthesis deacetylase BshB1 [Pyrinomonadaceae bacterium]|nr:bacillithiol biosynthesis deacetylase BshB1 [Pyrinomonadaceae bacterium]
MATTDVLGIFAHPDDLELQVGGTVLKLRSLGYTVSALDATRGEMGTRGTPEGRAEEAKAAAGILGLRSRENLGLKDGHTAVDSESKISLVKALRRLKPRLIITHQLDDPHPDHDHIARLVRESARLSSMKNFDPETGDEKIPVPMVAHNLFSRNVKPSFIVDISEHLERKMDAIKAYRSQFHDPNSNEPETRLTDKNFLADVENRSRYFGSLIGVEAGEPYFVREALNIEDPFKLMTRSMNLYS